MSYVVLARKYRPRTFAQMVGQEPVVQALGNALTQQRLHHAYLFTGTRGIGKTTVSRILAKSLNCTGPDGTGGITAEPCGVCQSCTEIDADRYLDYIEMDAASNRSIDEIRELIERAAYKPGVGRFKVFMIDEAHQLTKDAFNALLKTLEEPPEYLKFVLATTDPEKMLPTVLSRCLQFNLRPMAPPTVLAHLQQVLTAEQVSFDEAGLRLLSRAARGSMRDALSLTDQAIAYGSGQVTQAVVQAMLGGVDRRHAASLVAALAARNAAEVLSIIDNLRANGLPAAATLEELALLLQQMAVEQAVPGALDPLDPDAAEAQALAGALPRDETQLLYSMALQGRPELGLTGDEYAALTMVLLRFLAFVPDPQDSAAAGGAVLPGAAPSSPVPARDARGAALRAAAPTARASVAPVGVPPAAATQAPPEGAMRPSAERPPSGRGAAAPDTLAGAEAMPAVERVGSAGASAAAPAGPPDERATGASAGPATGTATSRDREVAASPTLDGEPPASTCRDGEPAAALSRGGEPAATPVSPWADRWDALVRRLVAGGSIAALVKELALQAGVVRHVPAAEATGPERWVLAVEREPLRNPVLADKLAAALTAEQGSPVVLELTPGVPADSPALRDAAERQRRQRQAEAVIQQDPLVRTLLAQFPSARLVPGSVKPV